MSHDMELRAIARQIAEGEAGAEERYIVANRQRVSFDEALDAFLGRINAKLREHYAVVFSSIPNPPQIARDERQTARAIKNVRVVLVDDPVHRSVYCFIERATGTILKSGGWKAPEPKRIPRGSIYALDPTRGCGPHGLAYVARGTRHSNYPWQTKDGALERIRVGPALPTTTKGPTP